MARRLLRWPSLPAKELPKRPYRDAAIFHAVLAAIIVLLAWATGGTVRTAVIVAAGYFLVAVTWTWWRFRERLRRAQRQSEP
jgi:membrane protein implicated in regulation of membrane protease activity